MVSMSGIPEIGKTRRESAFGHEDRHEPSAGIDPLNREITLQRTGECSGASLGQGPKVVADASKRNSDRLNPKETGMIATVCTTMDALGDTIEAKRELTMVRGSMPRVILASQSPRRRLLLQENGIEYTAVVSGIEDSTLMRGGVTPSEWVAALAYLKAAAVHDRLVCCDYAAGEVVVLGADTVVRKGDAIIGQPIDAADAERIIRLLQNGSHEVLTGVAFIDAATGRRDMWVDRSRVSVGDIGDARIAEYVASGDWRGKAGAYNLSERLAAGWPIEYSGDPGTIMGLPMQRMSDRLLQFRDACLGAMPN
jgi:septum formation protein